MFSVMGLQKSIKFLLTDFHIVLKWLEPSECGMWFAKVCVYMIFIKWGMSFKKEITHSAR